MQFWSSSAFSNSTISCKIGVIIKVYPGWKSMAAVPWSRHDHTMITTKHGLDHGMFLGMVVLIHSMIMVWLPCFPWFILWSWYDNRVFHVIFWNKMDCSSMVPQIVAAINHKRLTGVRGNYASKPPSQQHWTKTTLEIEFLFVITRKQVLIISHHKFSNMSEKLVIQ